MKRVSFELKIIFLRETNRCLYFPDEDDDDDLEDALDVEGLYQSN